MLLIVAFAIFANTLSGNFVYDDTRQITTNPLIQENELAGKALVSDVWAFKGDGTVTMSNYWRPAFTGWCIAGWRLFGSDPFGWHLMNILLNGIVSVLAFQLLRRLGAAPNLAFCIALIFTVHPVHTESVAWISGSPDILFAAFVLGSFLLALSSIDGKERSKFRLAAAAVLYALALGSKEVAIACLPLYFILFAGAGAKKRSSGNERAFYRTLPFALIAAAFFFGRWKILGTVSRPAEDAAGTVSALMSVPEIFVFYIKQIILPFGLGPNYPVRAVEIPGLVNFWIPIAVTLAVVFVLYLLAKKSRLQMFGVGLFLLGLLPVFNVTAFVPEQLVHDRYLYLPLLGFLMVVVPFFYEIIERRLAEKGEGVLVYAAVAISAALAFQTFTYNKVWASDLGLWQRAVEVDSQSSFNWSQLGSELETRGRTNDSMQAFTRSLQIKETPAALIGRARGSISKNDLDGAQADLLKAMAIPLEKINAYTLYQAYEASAIALQGQGRLTQAEQILRTARGRLPIFAAALTEKLGIVLYLQGRKDEALSELDGAKDQARREMLPASKSVFFRLGLLYAERGKNELARQYLAEYLRSTRSFSEPVTLEQRQQAQQELQRVK
jgi:tetratricopeptide (TPR) repeat protein